MSATAIEWADAGWNPTRGCTRVSEGCRHCYAERLFARHLPGHGGSTAFPYAEFKAGDARWTGRVDFVPEKLADPLRWRKARRIFVNSMSDLFHEKLADEQIAAVFGVMAAARHHTFLVLTKRPKRMLQWFRGWVEVGAAGTCDPLAEWMGWAESEGPKPLPRAAWARGWTRFPLPNVWLGVSVEDQATADERIPLLLQTPAAVRFVSYEPALGPINFRPWLYDDMTREDVALDWLIVGGESGPGARPFDLAWARSALAQCRAVGVPAFVKQLGARPIDTARIAAEPFRPGDRIPSGQEATPYQLGRLGELMEIGTVRLRDRKGGDPTEWPEDLRVREFPR